MKVKENQNFDSALHLNEGIDQPPSVNLHAANRYKNTKQPNKKDLTNNQKRQTTKQKNK